MLGFIRNHLDPSKMQGQAYDGAGNMSGKTNRVAARICSQYPLAPYTYCTFTVWTWQLWPHPRRWASVTWLVLWSDCSFSFFSHPSIRWCWKKLYRTPSQNQSCWSSKISAGQNGLNGSKLSIVSRNFTPPFAYFEKISAEGSHMWSPDLITDANTLLLIITWTESSVLLWLPISVYSISGASQRAFNRRIKTFRQCLRSRHWHHPSSKSERMLTPTTVGGLKQSLKCIMSWELYHQCPGNVVVCVTELAYQYLIPLNALVELSQFQFWTIFFLSLTSGLVHIKKLLFKVYTWYHQCWWRRSCNCVQCDYESGRAICSRPPKCFFFQLRSTTGTPSGNWKRNIIVQIHFLQLSTQHWPKSLAFTLKPKPLLLFAAPSQ